MFVLLKIARSLKFLVMKYKGIKKQKRRVTLLRNTKVAIRDVFFIL